MGAIRQDREAVLVTQACDGDRNAFDVLVVRHRSYVYGLAYRMCGDREAAEDICVEAFCEAYRSLPRFRPQAKFRTWLHRIAVNVCLEHLRKTRHPAALSAGSGIGGRASRRLGYFRSGHEEHAGGTGATGDRGVARATAIGGDPVLRSGVVLRGDCAGSASSAQYGENQTVLWNAGRYGSY